VDPAALRASLPSLHRPLLVASDLYVPATIRVSEAPTATLLPHSSQELRWLRSLRRLSAWRGYARRTSRKTPTLYQSAITQGGRPRSGLTEGASRRHTDLDRARPPRPVGLSHLLALDLAGRAARQFVDELDRARDLEA